MPQRLVPFLWFDTQAEEAARFYVSVFPNSRVISTAHYTQAGPGPEGSVMTVAFELDGQPFTALNGGPNFKFNPAVSFVIHCDTQAEIDRYWTKLIADGGAEVQCGWLTDRFGLSWQVVPRVLPELLQRGDKAAADRVIRALMPMKKLDIAALERAGAGR